MEEPIMHLTRTRLAIVLAVVAGALLGAIFGQPGTGRAASAAAPKNTGLPTISGTSEAGQTLTAIHGTWSGKPTSFSYAWSRCDSTGNTCAAIAGATARIYTVTADDVGHTLRVTVTARNASGSAQAASAPTGVVSPSGCPPGTGTLQIAQLLPPARLMIGNESISPSVTRSTHIIRIRLQVTACNGRPVQGATVFATPIPYNQFKGVSGATAADGTTTLSETRQGGFPASRHQELLAVLVRASKPGESPLDGVSTLRLVSFRVSVSHH
jgi:hypothetical protein